MSNTIRIKRRVSGAAGAPASLQNAELAFNEVDNTLYYGQGTGGVNGSATTVLAIGGTGAFVDLTGTQTISGTKTFSSQITGNISGNSGTATAWATPRNLSFSGDASGTLTSVDGTANVSGNLTLATVNSNVGTFTRVTVNSKGLVTGADTANLNDIASPTVAYSMGNVRLTNLASPTAASDAATRGYVDSVAQGIDAKNSVRVATTGNITLSGTQTIDDVAVVEGDRVLVRAQDSASENGIYVVGSSTWTRSVDADAWDELPAAYVFVESGTVTGSNGYLCTVTGGGTLGTTAVTWVQFSGAGEVTAGAGLTKTGNQLDVGAGTGITVGANDVALTGQALALHNLSTSGLFVLAAGNVVARNVDASGSGITVTSGDGVSGNPTVSLSVALSTVGGLTPSADQVAYYTGNASAALTTLTAFGRDLIAAANASVARGNLELGSMALQASNNVSITGGSISNITFDGGSF